MNWNGLVLLACACSSTCLLAQDAMQNYSLWPRRPEAIAEARKLIQQQELDEALKVLSPYVKERSIGGKEARLLTAQINKRRYLSRQNPHATIYKVRSGDHLARIATVNKTPLDFLYLLNGVIEPAQLKIGQQFVVAPMDLRIDIDVLEQELCVWDGEILVAAYPLLMVQSSTESGTLSVSSRVAHIGGQRVTMQSASYTSADRALKLSNGAYILGEQSLSSAIDSYRLSRRDMNELGLLINTGTPVRIVASR